MSAPTATMTTSLAQLFAASLREPAQALPFAAAVRVRDARPRRVILTTQDPYFDPVEHAEAGLANLTPSPESHSEEHLRFVGEGEAVGQVLGTAWVDVEWRGHRFELVRILYESRFAPGTLHVVVCDDEAVGRAYFQEVCATSAEIRDRVLVFANGCWQKSRDLYAAVQAASFDDVVLGSDLVTRLRGDFDRFLEAREQYERWGIPWKRGALFLGPPGNGKTLCIRALVRHMGLPCLYVQSLVAPHQPPESAIRDVFERARRSQPCVMVLEDLDALVRPEARSYFLNEMDGFASNTGLVTIASTNHPERLDPAILDRPSRFDRKYHFELPGEPERRRYVELWNAKLTPELRLDAESVARVAAQTDAFSFAYLKELFAAALMRFASEPGGGALADTLDAEAEALRAQMQTSDVLGVATPPELDDGAPVGSHAAAMMFARAMARAR